MRRIKVLDLKEGDVFSSLGHPTKYALFLGFTEDLVEMKIAGEGDCIGQWYPVADCDEEVYVHPHKRFEYVDVG